MTPPCGHPLYHIAAQAAGVGLYGSHRILIGDVLDGLRSLPDGSARCCVTSPPYWGLRDYGVDGQIGLEPTPEAYVARMVEVFREVRRVLADDGTLWLNLASSYFGTTPGSGGKTSKQVTNAGSFFSGTQPSRPRADAPACGIGGTELQGSRAAGRACPCCGGELQDGSVIRRAHIERTGQPTPRAAQPLSQTDRDIAPVDSSSALPAAATTASRKSTTRASRRRERAACVPAGTASALPSEPQTSPCCVRACADTTACTCDTSRSGRPSANHTTGTGLFCTACGYCTTTPHFKHKDMVPIPWMVAFALQADGWYLRSDIIWAKPNPMPESVTDRPTKSHEYVFLLSKRERYYFDADAIKEPSVTEGDDRASRYDAAAVLARPDNGSRLRTGNPTGTTRNARTVWTIATQPYSEAHFATFPEAIPEKCIKAGSAVGDTVLDPFTGSGTTLLVACRLGRNGIGCELNPEYAAMAERRIGAGLRPSTFRDVNAVEAGGLFP